jgi:hypothetical protein
MFLIVEVMTVTVILAKVSKIQKILLKSLWSQVFQIMGPIQCVSSYFDYCYCRNNNFQLLPVSTNLLLTSWLP